LRTTPARKPRTECCCQSVTAMIAAIVAPAGFLSIAMTRACFVWCPTVRLDDAGAGRLRDTGLAVFRAVGRVVAFGLDLGLSWDPQKLVRRYPPHHLGPARTKRPAGQDPEGRLSRPSHHSNAPIKPESQSILSKISGSASRSIRRPLLAEVCERMRRDGGSVFPALANTGDPHGPLRPVR
jgi:hypothetical protein